MPILQGDLLFNQHLLHLGVNYGSLYHMREICTINNQIWSNEDIGHQFLGLKIKFAFNRCFYDPITGEIWARRVTLNAEETAWIYHPQHKHTLDMTIPIEWLEDKVPIGLKCAVLVGLVNKLESEGKLNAAIENPRS